MYNVQYMFKSYTSQLSNTYPELVIREALAYIPLMQIDKRAENGVEVWSFLYSWQTALDLGNGLDEGSLKGEWEDFRIIIRTRNKLIIG